MRVSDKEDLELGIIRDDLLSDAAVLAIVSGLRRVDNGVPDNITEVMANNARIMAHIRISMGVRGERELALRFGTLIQTGFEIGRVYARLEAAAAAGADAEAIKASTAPSAGAVTLRGSLD